ncbi:hypothetical protein MC7420_3141 [Coleofasciculus chthonoplastes PCC 7420]|uniref:Uncharacterized protein n=1 Tax=Coleofasciculus chthonoplastes PCC 7420 TaxID=118168 RepID=B4VJY9_9CYAN|nr:hypothetical protein MC7420_3141 [Coleofasciculus chthonoplastes PCC 7420]
MGDQLRFWLTKCLIAIVRIIRTGLTTLTTRYSNQPFILCCLPSPFCDQQSGVSLHPCQLMSWALLFYV